MKQIVRYGLILLFGCSWSKAAETIIDNLERRHAITDKIVVASADGVVVPFGLSTRLRVAYANTSEKDWMVRELPDQSGAVSFHIVYKFDPLERWGRSFTTEKIRFHTSVRPDGTMVESILLDPDWKPPPSVTLKPKEKYEFQFKLSEGSPFMVWHPGTWLIYIKDNSIKRRTQEIEVVFAFTSETVSTLLRLAFDNNASLYDRMKACRYLEKLKPDWAYSPPKENQTEAQRAESDAKWQKSLKEFEIWWKKNGETAEVQKRIDDINREYGLDPIAIRKALAGQKPSTPGAEKGTGKAPVKAGGR